MTQAQKQWLRFLAYAVVIILVNIAAATLFFRLDLTKNRIYSLSQVSKNAVADLEEPLTIKVYFSNNLPSPYNNLEQEVSDLLEEYRIQGSKFFNYSIRNIENEGASESEKSRAARTDAQSYGIYPIQIQKIERSEINLVNAFMGMVFIQGDLIETIPVLSPAQNLEYQITGMIKKMGDKTGALLALEEDVEIKLYFSSALLNAGGDLRNYPDSIAAVVGELNRENYGRLAFQMIDPQALPPGEVSPENYQLSSLTVQLGRPAVSTQVYASLLVKSGERYAGVNLLNRGIFGYQVESPEVVKESLSGVINRLTGSHPKIGYLASHGCPPFYGSGYGQSTGEPELNSFRGLVSQSYDIVQVDLRAGEIPPDIESLIITGPSESFTEWEIYQLDQFVMRGNSLMLFLDTHTEIFPSAEQMYYQAQPFYFVRELGLEGFLGHYGFNLAPSFVLDEQCYIQTQQQRDGSLAEIPLYFAPLANAKEINQKSPILKNVKGLIFFNSSPLILSESPYSGQKPEVLVQSSPTSWEMTENINLYNPLMIMPPSSGERKSQVLAASADGPMDSFFANKPIPEAPKNQEQGDEAPETGQGLFPDAGLTAAPMLTRTDRGQIFLTGSAYMVMDNLVDARGTGPNAVFIQNVVDWANGREDFALMRSKGLSYNPLDETSGGTKSFIQIFAIAGLPILVVLFAILFWFRWMARKKSIELLFKDEEK